MGDLLAVFAATLRLEVRLRQEVAFGNTPYPLSALNFAKSMGKAYPRALVSVQDHLESLELFMIPCLQPDSQEPADVDCREPRPL